ncbi:MAG: GNAT family N-acetyltransferase [Hyphococcus sp.]
MFLTNTTARSVFEPTLVNGPVYLRPPETGDHGAWALLRTESRPHLVKWEQDWTADSLTLASFRHRLRAYEKDARRASGLSLFVFRAADDALLGGLTLTNIRYGAARAGTLGYWIGAAHARKGYGKAAVDALLAHAFGAIDLNRVEAACHPDNAASQRLLAACGFAREGRAEDYLRINGKWRDHDLFAMTARRYRALSGP